MSQAAPSPQSLIRLSYNNEITFHSDAAAGGLWAQGDIKGLVALISSDLLGMAALTLCQRRDLQLCRCVGDDATAAPAGRLHVSLRKETGIPWTRLI